MFNYGNFKSFSIKVLLGLFFLILSLFLFASSYALIHEGHVRVDILYTNFSEKGKAWSNLIGSLLLGIPICLTKNIIGLKKYIPYCYSYWLFCKFDKYFTKGFEQQIQ